MASNFDSSVERGSDLFFDLKTSKKTSTKYNVKIKRDDNRCSISSICETDTGELLIADTSNSNVKLLDQTYKVLGHCKLPHSPYSICSIDYSLVAVVMPSCEVLFIRVKNGKLLQDRTLNLQHCCHGIAHHHGNLYIRTNTALYHYTVDGRLVSKLYEDTMGGWTVASFAMSPDEDRIYVINRSSNTLVTLSMDGTVISTLTDLLTGPFRLVPHGLHVTDSGQVLVCGAYSNAILQLDRDGGQRLAEWVTEKGDVTVPTCVFYSKHNRILVVGMLDNNDMLVLNIHRLFE